MTMKTRTLGPNGPQVSALGLGRMGTSDFYGGRDELAAIGEALPEASGDRYDEAGMRTVNR